MSLTVKHLNADASFLLTFRPLLPHPRLPGQPDHAFTIVLDPWLGGTSKIWHSKFSISKHRVPACITSLLHLPEPDLVIISQPKSDHCHKATLIQLPPTGGKTRILAEPGAASTIKSWKHFDSEKIVSLPKWEHPRMKPNATVYRISIPSLTSGGSPGEVTVSFIPQRSDITGLHNAIGITYRPPALSNFHHNLPDTPPDTPPSYQSTFSASVADRALSVIFSPHGCNYKTLLPWVTSHLMSEAALPLTALLHCFDRVQNSWYMGGNICAGFPGGLEIVQNLLAKVWISAHDGDKDTTGFASNNIKVVKYAREEVESVISPRSDSFPERRVGTEAVILASGGEMTLTGALDFGLRDGVERRDKYLSMNESLISEMTRLSMEDTSSTSTAPTEVSISSEAEVEGEKTS